MWIAIIGAQLDDWGNVAAIVAATLTIVIVVPVGISGMRAYKRRRAMRDPLSITYLIPQSQYRSARFKGAPGAELFPTALTVATGSYRIMHAITPVLDVAVDRVELEFTAGTGELPELKWVSNPYLIDEDQRDEHNHPIKRTWHGQPVRADQLGLPTRVGAGEPLVIGHRIEVGAPYSGELHIAIRFRTTDDDQPHEVAAGLAFTADRDEGRDQVPFLRS